MEILSEIDHASQNSDVTPTVYKISVSDLVDFSRKNGKHFAMKLIMGPSVEQGADEQEEKHLMAYKTFCELSMPNLVYRNTYTFSKQQDLMSTIATSCEEAFAALIVENLINVWISEVHHKVKGKVDSHTIPDFVLEDNFAEAKYQRNYRTKKNKLKIGPWSDSGIRRFNELVGKHSEITGSSSRDTTAEEKKEKDARKNMEEKLMSIFANEHKSNSEKTVRGKRKKKKEKKQKERVKPVNMFKKIPVTTALYKV